VIVLNVGGGASRYLPSQYDGWSQDLLDIDPQVKPDIVCDAKQLRKLTKKYDAVFCSHNLEHFYKHEVPVVLEGFTHVLNDNGFAQVSVPNLGWLMEHFVKSGLDIDDAVYECAPGQPISYHDMLYGWGKMMRGGNAFYAHKCGFTEKSLGKALSRAGFKKVMVAEDSMNLIAYAFKSAPTKAQTRQLGL